MDFISSLYSSVFYKFSKVSTHYFYTKKVVLVIFTQKKCVSFVSWPQKFNAIKVESQE